MFYMVFNCCMSTMCMSTMDRTKMLTTIAVVLSICGAVIADQRCYVCSSYMEQCKEEVDTYKGYAHRGRCYSKCFVRLGEDGAIYRGCFDGFKEVPFLTSDYNGCKEQSWNGQTLPWCFCDGDLCNKVSMKDMGYKSDVNVGQGYTVNSQENSLPEYTAEYGQAHYVDNMDNYVEQKLSGSVHNSQTYKQQNEKDKGYESDKKADYDSKKNNYAKEGYVDESGYEIKEVNHAADISKEQLKQLDNYMQDYYSQNGYQPVYYGGEYDRFHYYQVEDPNAYMEETSPDKYIAMDESEGFKVVIDASENEIVEKKPVAKDAKEGRDDQPIAETNQVDTKTGDLYGRNDYVYNAGFGTAHQASYNDHSQGYQNQLYQSYQNEKQNTGLKDDFKTEGQTEEEEDPYYFPPHLAEKIECAKTGFYQNPDDCRTFVACILDAHVRRPYMHMMRCPEGLVWDNHDKICNQFSTTCNVAGYVEGSLDQADRQVEFYQEEQQQQQPSYGSYQQQQPAYQANLNQQEEQTAQEVRQDQQIVYDNRQQQQQYQASYADTRQQEKQPADYGSRQKQEAQPGYDNRQHQQLQQDFMKYAEEEKI